MATAWNPNAATTLGLETFFTAEGEALIAGGAAAATTFDSTVSQTIDTITLFLAGAEEDPSTVLLEVFTAGTEDNAAEDITTSTFRPIDDLQIGGVDSEGSTWIEGSTAGGLGSLGTTNLYTAIDEATLDVDDWITYNGTRAARKRYRFNVGTAGGNWPASQRVVGGRVKLVINRESVNGRLEVGYYNGTSTYRLGTVTATPQRRTVTIQWPEYNPATGLPWTRAEIQALASGSAIQLRTVGVGKQKRLRVYQAWLELDWVTENRLAVGRAEIRRSVAPEAGRWVSFNVQVPNSGAATWAKGTADYTLVLRRIAGLGTVGWRWLEEGAEVAAALGRSAPGLMLPFSTYVPTLDGRGFVSDLGPAAPGRAMAFYMSTATPTVSVDGQPYTELDSLSMTNDAVDQEFTVTTAASYSRATFILGYEGDLSSLPPIDVSIIRASDSAVMASTAITASQVAAFPELPTTLPGGFGPAPQQLAHFHLVYVDFPPTALAAATQYALTLDPRGYGPPYSHWHIYDVASHSTPAELAGFGGTTDQMHWNGGVARPAEDVPMLVAIAVDAPSSFDAVAVPEVSGNEGECGPGFIDRVSLTHSAASFGRYEYQRWEAPKEVNVEHLASSLHYGDSNTEGDAVDSITKRWTNVLQDKVRAAFPSDGPGAGGGIGYIEASSNAATILDEPVLAGGATAGAGGGLGHRNAVPNAGSVTWPAHRATTIRVWYMTIVGSGKLNVSIDGDVHILDCASAVAEYDDAYFDYEVEPGEHVVVVTRNSVGVGIFPQPIVSGVQFFDGDEEAGAFCFNAAFSGVGADYFANGVTGGSVLFTDLADQIRLTTPQVVTIMLGTIEFLTDVSPTDYGIDLLAMVAAIREAHAGPLYLMAAFKVRNATPSYAWSDYVTELEEVAAATDAGVIDMSGPDWPQPDTLEGDASGYYYFDGIHLTEAGHVAVADLVFERTHTDFGFGSWSTIRTDTDPLATSHDDWEARLGLPDTYRVRQVRDGDLIASPWSLSAAATAARYGHETKVASNHANAGRGAAVAYERGPEYEWGWEEPVERFARQGGDGRWSFHGSEDPGHDSVLDLLVYDGPGPVTPGVDMFGPLRRLLRADVPHLAFCDADGGRAYGDGVVTTATRTEYGGEAVYEATVEAAQTQFAPTPVEE